MREPVAGTASPITPSPWLGGSPGGQAADTARPPPQILDHQLLRAIGRGAYGQVWLARNVVGRLRAVKAVYGQDFAEPQPFEREFRGIQKFEPVSRSHDGLIDILQIGRNDAEGYFYYVMELADDATAECRVQNVESSRAKRSEGKPATETPTPSTLHSSLFTPTRRIPSVTICAPVAGCSSLTV